MVEGKESGGLFKSTRPTCNRRSRQRDTPDQPLQLRHCWTVGGGGGLECVVGALVAVDAANSRRAFVVSAAVFKQRARTAGASLPTVDGNLAAAISN